MFNLTRKLEYVYVKKSVRFFIGAVNICLQYLQHLQLCEHYSSNIYCAHDQYDDYITGQVLHFQPITVVNKNTQFFKTQFLLNLLAIFSHKPDNSDFMQHLCAKINYIGTCQFSYLSTRACIPCFLFNFSSSGHIYICRRTLKKNKC